MELSPLFKPVSVSALVLPLQFGAASISWHSALRECWTDASLLPFQEEVVYGSKLSHVVQLGPPHWSMRLKGWCQHSQWGTTITQSTLLQHRLILVTSYRRSVILTHPTGVGFLQPGHTAVTGTVWLKPHTITLNTCFRVESATVVSDTAQCNVLSCKELVPTILTQCGVITRIVTTK